MRINLIFAVIVAIFFSFCVNKLYKRTIDYSNSRIDIRCFKEYVPSKFKIVNLGSTYSKFAFGSARELGLNWGDFTLQAQSLEMDYALLKKYANMIAPQGVVVVVVAACLLLYRETGENYLYYDLLDKNENPQYKITTKLKSYFPLFFPLRSCPKKIVHFITGVYPLKDIHDLYPQQMSEEESLIEMERLYTVWKRLFQINDFSICSLKKENFTVIERNCEVLKEMFQLCLDKNLKPIVVVPPFSERMNRYFSKEFKEVVLTNTINRAIGDKQIPFLNYQDDKIFQDNIWLFSDGGFRLNRLGSKVFIRRLSMDLRSYNITINNKLYGVQNEYR